MPTFRQPEDAYDRFLELLNVSSLAEARGSPSEGIIAANEAQVAFHAPRNNYIFGPVVDGPWGYTPDVTSSLFRAGKFDAGVAVLAGHTCFEGGMFFDAEVTTDEQFRPWLERSLVGLSKKEVDHLVDVLYPPVYDAPELLGYEDVQSRQMAVWGEAVIDCNFAMVVDAIANGKPLGKNIKKQQMNKSWAYQFAVKPGFHIQDTKYVFNDPTSPVYFADIRDQMQEMIVGFVKTGVPRLVSSMSKDGKIRPGREVTPWGEGHGHGGRNILRIDEEGFKMARSRVNGTRCAWWSSFQTRRGDGVITGFYAC